MDIYLVVTRNNKTCTWPVKTFWKKENAQELIQELEKKEPQYYHSYWPLEIPDNATPRR